MPNDENVDLLEGEESNEEIKELMHDHDLDVDTAARVKDLMDDEGLDEDVAVELVEEGY